MLPVYCYCRRNKEGEIIEAPFLEYLTKKYLSSSGIKQGTDKQLRMALAVIHHIAGKDGRGYNFPPHSDHYEGHDFGTMKLHEGRNLIRIAYWARIGDKLVILTATDKPDLYEKSKKKEVNKKIDAWLKEA